MLVKAFSYRRGDDLAGIGVIWRSQAYDFTLAWEAFKNLEAGGRGPSLQFLQVMIELGYFELETFLEVMEALEKRGLLPEFRLQGKYAIDVPVARPQKILCVGRNYREHAEEWGASVPDEPIVFAKLPSALLPHGGTILVPKGVGSVEHEIELGVVIGKGGVDISPDRAWDHIAGYTVVNDVTARALQLEDFRRGWPWLRSKSFDTFCPVGPYVVPRGCIRGPLDLRLELRVNGQLRQRARTSEMVFDVPTLVSTISRWCTLHPGDLICTGTPAGTGPIRPGDVVEAEIEGIGTLRSYVAARE
ncbi:MAG: fumarylacetoacetate hydrolase family protein [candidate division KSB1 bacterium]|nr:fumarylacetoacetate hydrolase family protein [candidate division KSB1 bacterium]